MTPALAWLVVPACLLAARAGVHSGPAVKSSHHGRSVRALALPPGCLYDGRWYTEGEVVSSSQSACLLCACVRGALSCRRQACAPLPDPPPDRCYALHRKDSCCPELRCPDGVTSVQASTKLRIGEDLSDIATPASVAHACVEGGSVFAAGSAMRANSACEACFCLQGARRCVTPKCLPPPHGCTARATPGACCPTRYYCQHDDDQQHDRRHECEVNGKWVAEGERVVTEETKANCTQCFCLRGSVRCQPLACAPPLLGCQPLLRPGECCPHQYHCAHDQGFSQTKPDRKLAFTRSEERAFYSPKLSKHESTTTYILTVKNTPTTSLTNSLVATTKVKRKTNDPPPSSSQNPVENTTTQASQTKVITTSQVSATEGETEQPDETVKVIINGTINCTAEISSTSLPKNMSFDDAVKAAMDVQPRIPIVNIENLDHTYSPNDIITDRNIDVFDDNESFTINVTSSLMTNTSHSTKPPVVTVSKSGVVADAPNSSKKTKGDYDYDYTEPTLPPSLPNLKIIPFVAADAVVDEEPPKETLNYPLLEREDKFPVYYPNVNQKEIQYATRREGVYDPTQYPVFISNKDSQYPTLTHELGAGYVKHDDLEYTVATSLGNRVPEVKEVTKLPITSTKFSVETPVVNMFSPPVETEGGFVPKDPGIIDDYYAVYPSSTPPAPVGPAVPHLTTSMQLDIIKDECVVNDGQRIEEGETIVVGCTRCDCTWSHLHCVPIDCPVPPGCRRTISKVSDDVCCGKLVCDEDDKTTPMPTTTTEKNKPNNTVVRIKNISLTLKVDTPTRNTTNKNVVDEKIKTDSKNVTKIEDIFKQNKENISITTTTTIKPVTNVALTTEASTEKFNQTYNNSQEYEDEEDDEGFSFGSVLKLLLSDNYETTTVSTKKPTTPKLVVTKPIATSTRRPTKQTLVPFIPLPALSLPPIKPPINRIDHLLLGETTAIKTTRLPISTKPVPKTTQAPTKPPEIEQIDQVKEAPRLPNLGIGPGLLKLAGCNIYGRMYRVGRIIAELSTPCQECWCTEFGVQCKPLKC